MNHKPSPPITRLTRPVVSTLLAVSLSASSLIPCLSWGASDPATSRPGGSGSSAPISSSPTSSSKGKAPAVSSISKSSSWSSSSTPMLIRGGITSNLSHVELTQGKAQVIRIDRAATRISISDPEKVGMVMLSPTEIQLIGKAIGSANLLIWSQDSGASYLTIDLSVQRDVASLARKIQMIDAGINILPVAAEDSVVLTGVAESLEKAQLAYDLTKAFFTSEAAGATAGGGDGANQEMSSNSPGSSSMTQANTKIINMIRVIGQPTTKAEMVQERLKEIDPNIVLKVVPGFGGKEKALLTGRVRNASMVSKAVNMASIFYGTPGIKVLTGPGGNVVKEGQASSASNNFEAGGGGLIGNLAGNILHGSIITDMSGNVVSVLEVTERPQVRCSIKFLEVQKNALKQYEASTFFDDNGLKLTTYGSRANPDFVVQNALPIVTGNQLLTQVNGASNGQLGIQAGRTLATVVGGLITSQKAKVLAEPTITSISGEPASFIAGGEFPVPVIGTNGATTILFKQFGIKLDLLATLTDHDTIHMQVSPEVSALDRNNGTPVPSPQGVINIPGVRTRRSQTVVELRQGENFVLGGLYSQDMSDAYLKTPLLGQIPILGSLFRSRDFRDSKTEMLIVIHPEIVSTADLDKAPVAQTSSVGAGNTISQVVKLNPEVLAKHPHDTLITPTSDERSQVSLMEPSPKALKKAQRKALKASKKMSRGVNQAAPSPEQPAPVIDTASDVNSTQSILEKQKSELSTLIDALTSPTPMSDSPDFNASGASPTP